VIEPTTGIIAPLAMIPTSSLALRVDTGNHWRASSWPERQSNL